ncbi:MAG: cupin domain-containing protein [Tissierellia bacterium]|nr:cupin domain-containing protein [Tissierellia bacterium]
MRDAAYYIEKYDMVELPEGGYFAPLVRGEFSIPKEILGENYSSDRESVSIIYYLLESGDISKWHMLRSEEHWLWHDGGKIEITISEDEGFKEFRRLVLDPYEGDFCASVPAGYWQTAKVIEGDFCLVTCVVSPAYHDDEIFFLEEK